MYISEIIIKNYRNFNDEKVLFNPGLNIIIGHNNAGKTNLLRALQLVIDRKAKEKPTVEDFCKENICFDTPPLINISITISEHNDSPDDKGVVYDWLIQESPQYKAQLTYIFELPTKHHDEYKKLIEECKDDSGKYKRNECLRIIEKKFYSKYVSKIYGGNPSKQEKADPEHLDRFDFQFLNAIRDAERQMFYGNNTLLRDVLNYFLDYDLTNGQGFENLEEKDLLSLKKREDDFKEKSKELLEQLINRIDKEKITLYSKNTGADKGGKPDFDAEISEQELLFALRLIVDNSAFKIPIKNNGLGYNNLLFIALILAKMQMESSAFMGDNAKVFPILVIEEPEAHLHPAMQSKFLKFLESNLENSSQARQMFVTSHSTHIASAVDLSALICLYRDIENKSKVGYPSKVFKNTTEDKNSKIYVQRFLDATKSNMLFSDRLIFVEGLTEQLLVPALAAGLGKEQEMIDKHVSIISVDSRTFKHFLKIFSYSELDNPYAINKRVVCITDADPSKKDGNKWKTTYPFCLEDSENSKPLSIHVQELKEQYATKFRNISIHHPEEKKGKTFEYEIAFSNPTSKLLITDSFPQKNSPHTKDNYIKLISKYHASINDILQEYRECLGDEEKDNEILKGIENCKWSEEERKKSLIAAIYYKIVKNAKGENAFCLEKNIRENYKSFEKNGDFTVPKYIEEAIKTILE